MTCQCRHLKLNLLSTQINIYCVMTDQNNACVAGTTWSVNASCSYVITVPLFFCPPPSRAIIPDARPLGTFENQDSCGGKPISRKNRGCEQSMFFQVLVGLITGLCSSSTQWPLMPHFFSWATRES